MSQTERPKLKVSRRGLELIKSFEGFRPRAERLDDGRWIIGHGHTLSAREGAEVTAGEAELLLQYDLLPILNAVAERVSLPLNQHQVDALASFGLNLGLERFLASEVLVWVNAGEPEDAARALSAHAAGAVTAPDPIARRRAAESALFRHDPDREADLAELLAAPVAAPPPPSQQTAQAPDPAGDARAMAVAVLLGETDSPPGHEAPAGPGADELPVIVPFFAAPDVAGRPESAAPQIAAPDSDVSDPAIVVDAANENNAAAEPVPPEGEAPADAAGAAPAPAHVLQAMRFHQPYAISITGPLPLGAPSAEGADAPPPVQEAAAPSGETLVLTSPPEVEAEPPTREVWPDDARPGPAAEEEPLFIEDPALRMGGQPVFMPENFDPEPGGRFDWSETGAFLGMGGVGLAAFGAAIVGFRMATDRPTGAILDQTTVAAGILALIGALCVGISSYNLYLRWSRRNDG